MSGYIKEDASYFDGFDFENVKPIKHPLIAQAQARAKMTQEQEQEQEQNELINFFDNDVQQVIKQHNTPKDRMRVNQMIRLLFATA
jgi:DNA-binding TFAR19-related protein (PDSD5 family)